MARLSEYDALTFDVYGTLIDWETGMANGLADLHQRSGLGLSRDQILEAHARHESTQQAQTPAKPYREILALVYKRLAEEWRVSARWSECETYGDSVRNWPAFPDSAEALSYLKDHFDLFVLSNVDNRSFSHSDEKLGHPFTAVYSAEEVGSYKPDPGNFDYMIRQLWDRGIGRQKILHTAESMFHDHVPAQAAGLDSCHIYRRHDQHGFGATMPPGAVPEVLFRFTSMAELVEAHRLEQRSE